MYSSGGPKNDVKFTDKSLAVGRIYYCNCACDQYAVHIQALKQNYLEAIEWRAQALAQTLIGIARETYPYSANVESLLS